MLNALERLELEYGFVKYIPVFSVLEFQENEEIVDREDVFVIADVSTNNVVKNEYNWKPGTFLNENHDYQVYSKHYKENLLNFDSKIHKFSDDFKWENDIMFIRPCADNKVFTGKVFNKDDWKEFVSFSLTNGHKSVLNENTPIQVCSVKDIYKESRFWIVNGKIATASQYILGGKVSYQEEIDQNMHDFCLQMVDKFQLADAFVMDVADTKNGFKIIECGCINCAGFYAADTQKLFIALENTFN